MKKISLIITIIVLLTSCVQKNKKDFESGVLWQIESRNGKKSFIFGTLHMYPKNEIKLSKKVISNLEKCKVLVIERKRKSETEQQMLDNFKRTSFDIESGEAILAKYGDELAGMELELMEKALQSNLTITGLETTKETLKIMAELQKIDDRKFDKGQVLRDYKEIVRQYNLSSIGGLYEDSKKRMGKEMTEILLDKRNRKWIDDIEMFIHKDETFIAVGVAHLAGKTGVLNLLTKEGYQLTRVE